MIRKTGRAEVDENIRVAIDLLKNSFQDRFVSSYLSGSYANGYAVATSDVDLYNVVRGNLSDEDKAVVEKIQNDLETLEPPVDCGVYELEHLQKAGEVEMGKYMIHLWGDPVHELIPNPPLEDYIYRFMHVGYMRMEYTRREKPYHWPLQFPKPDEVHKGYDWRTLPLHGAEVSSLKEIVVGTGWMATGLVAWKGRTFVPTKYHCPTLFQQIIGGEVAEAFREVTDFCRTKMQYLLPQTEEDREYFQTLLPKVLLIENYFLENYQHFLIEQLRSSNPVRVRTSKIRLGEIVYPNDLTAKALRLHPG